MPDKARRTAVHITFDGADITSDIMPYFLSLSYKDSEEDGSDTLQLDLQDRDALWLQSWLDKAIKSSAAARLSFSATIQWENTDDPSALPTGSFELDSVEAAGPPSTVSISGVSLGYSSPIRQTKKSKVWKNLKLSAIAADIAQKGGIALVFETSNNPYIERVEQTKKADISFLSDLCHDYGISLKCSDKQLVLFDQAAYEAKPPVVTIKRNNGRILPAPPQAYGAFSRESKYAAYISYKLSTDSAETQYGSCRVSYMDPASGQLISGTATADGDDSDSEQVLEITAKVNSPGQAQELAAQQLRLHNKFNRTASFTLPGNPHLAAGLTVRLEDFGGWSGKYIIKQAEHAVSSSSGYTTKIQLRKCLKDDDVTADDSSSGTGSGSSYTVQKGDSLWKIAKQLYGSGSQWKKIYDANKAAIGDNPNLILPGQVLTIPS